MLANQVQIPSKHYVTHARSLRNKIGDLLVQTSQTNSDIMCIIETWLTNLIPDEVVHVNGYITVRKDRANGTNGGGICTYIKKTLPDLSHNSIECVWITIRPKWLPRSVSRIAIATLYL